MSEKFEKCEALNLDINVRHEKPGPGKWDYYILAADVERLLSEGVEMFGGTGRCRNEASFENPFDMKRGKYDTHTGLLINIRPIERDSAEKVLRDLVNLELGKDACVSRLRDLISRAKKLNP